MRALAVDPALRYQTGEELRADLASFLAKHSPATDAATLASFMAHVFRNQIDAERTDRDRLLSEASALLSGPIAAVGSGDAAESTPRPKATAFTRLVDPALWDSAPGARNAELPSVRAHREVPNAAPRGKDDVADPRAVTGALRTPAPPSFPPESVMLRMRRRRQLDDRRRRPAGANAKSETSNTPYRVYGGLPDSEPLPSPFAAGALITAGGVLPLTGVPPSPDGAMGAAAPAASGDEDPRVGTTIAARYFVRRLCGEGAMGRVYEGHHIEIGRRVAIKVLHSSFHNTPDVVERFRREARAASRIGHPNIVDVTDSGTTPDGAFFFVMEYLDGVDLEQLLAREGPLAIDRALLIAAQVCRALIAAHAAGIIHRDLKPANVMLVRHRDEEDFVKVLDFGISKQSALDTDSRGKEVGLTRPDAAVGTPIYMAPEQVAGHPADGRTDVYAVGELLFEMLTGVAPCSGGDIIAVFNKKANEDPVAVRSLRPEVPERIERLLVRAMSRALGDRHPSMTALKDDIMSGLSSIDAALIPPGGPQPADPSASNTGRGWRPSAAAVWLMAGGVVAGLGLAALAILSGKDLRGGPASGAPAQSSPIARTLPPELPKSEVASPARRAGPDRDTAAVARPTASDLEVQTNQLSNNNNNARLRPVRSTLASPALPPHPPFHPAASQLKRVAPSQAKAVALSSSPQPPDDLVRGRAAFAKGNFPDAVHLGRAALTSGDAVGAHLLLGDAFYKMDRFRDAIAQYDAVLKSAPANPQALRGRELALRRAPP
jgi:serine/threonine-protein kinase